MLPTWRLFQSSPPASILKWSINPALAFANVNVCDKSSPIFNTCLIPIENKFKGSVTR